MSRDSRSSDFFVAGGTLRPNALSYVERPADDELFNLALAGEYCYVLTPRQMGKSSLMVRTAQRLEEQGVRTATIDLTESGTIKADAWYLELITELARALRLSVDPEAWWQARASLGHTRRFTNFLRDVVLTEIEGQVVIFIDEIDSTLRLEFSDDFFAAIRAMYNARSRDSKFERLNFVLLGVASPSDLIKDRTRTPYNIGQAIALKEFSRDDAAVLQAGLEAVHPGQGAAIFARIYHWTGGHPYLTQKICQAVAGAEDRPWPDEGIDEQVEKLFLSKEASKEANLKFVRDRILDHPQQRQLLDIYRRVYKGKRIADDEQSPLHNQLKLSGLLKAEDGYLQIRNEIYRRVFDSAWVRENTATNWAPIVAGIAVFVALLAVGSILYNAWVGIQFRDCIASFYQTKAPEERVTHLARIFRLRGLFGPTDYDYQARELFYGLSREEQLALFSADTVEDSDLTVAIKGLCITLADIDGTDSTRPLLEAMVQALDSLDETKEANDLRNEINSWLKGRELAKPNQYADALAEYSSAIALNGENPATLYERAKVLIELSEYQQALSDLDQVIAIAGRAPAPTPTAPSTTPAVSPTPTTEPPISPTLTPTSTSTPGMDTTPTEPSSSASVTATSTSFPISTETPTNTPLPTYTPTPAAITSEFATTGQMIGAVRNIIYGNPDLVRSLASASDSEYPNLREFGLAPTPIPADLVTPAPDIIVILIADFDGPEPEKYRITETVLARMRAVLEPYDSGQVEALGRVITEVEGSAAARVEGEKREAAIVIWGWYGVTAEAVTLNVHFELLRPPEHMPELGPEVKGEVQTIAVAELENFTPQTQLSTEMAYLSLFTIGMTRYAEEDWDAAIIYFSDALGQTAERVPALDQSAVYFYRGLAYARKDDYDRAIADYDQAIQLRPDYTEAYNNRGNIRADIGDYESAIADYDQAIQLRPDYAEAYNNRGNIRADIGDYESAIADYDQAIQLEPDYAEAYNSRGLACADIGDYDRAIADYDQAILLQPDFAGAYNNRGLAYADIGDYDGAIADYTKAIELNPDHAAGTYLNRGNVYRDSGDFEQAVRDYTNAIESDPEFAGAYNNRGLAYRDSGDLEQAILDFNKAIELDPGYAPAYNNRGNAYYDSGDFAQAILDLERYLELALDAPDRETVMNLIEQLKSELQLPAVAEMVSVPAGEFIMGSSDAEVDSALVMCNKNLSDCQRDWFKGEQPQHTVYLDAFYIDKTEVTNAQYRACVEADVCDVPTGTTYYDDADYAKHPVLYVSWNDADAYCRWVDKRLPTEAEWEKAARGTDGWIYPWGNSFDESKLNSCDVNCPYDWKDASANDGYAETAPVGSYPAGASPYGALDMAGNVWEWVADWYWYDYYSRSPNRNPPGPGSGVEQVLRGGSWDLNAPHLMRSSNRSGRPPDYRFSTVGFRCARSALSTSTPPKLTSTPTSAIVGSTMVALMTFHDRYVTALNDEDNRDWVLRAETTELKDWEKFTLLCLGNGKIALGTYHGRYVTAMDAGRDWVLRAETSVLSDWETFTLVEPETEEELLCSEVFRLLEQGDVGIALKTYHGRYVTAMDDQTGRDWELRAEITELLDWEKFTVIAAPSELPLQWIPLPSQNDVYAQNCPLIGQTTGFYKFDSGQATISANLVSEGHTGQGLRLDFTAYNLPYSYSGWEVLLGDITSGIDLTSYNSLTFYIRGAEGSETPNVWLMTPVESGGYRRYYRDVETYKQVTTQWQEVVIPLADFTAGTLPEEEIDLYHINKIQVVLEWYAEPTSETIYIDDLCVVP